MRVTKNMTLSKEKKHALGLGDGPGAGRDDGPAAKQKNGCAQHYHCFRDRTVRQYECHSKLAPMARVFDKAKVISKLRKCNKRNS